MNRFFILTIFLIFLSPLEAVSQLAPELQSMPSEFLTVYKFFPSARTFLTKKGLEAIKKLDSRDVHFLSKTSFYRVFFQEELKVPLIKNRNPQEIVVGFQKLNVKSHHPFSQWWAKEIQSDLLRFTKASQTFAENRDFFLLWPRMYLSIGKEELFQTQKNLAETYFFVLSQTLESFQKISLNSPEFALKRPGLPFSPPRKARPKVPKDDIIKLGTQEQKRDQRLLEEILENPQ